MNLILIPVAFLYLVVDGILFIFGVNFFYLTYLALKRYQMRPSTPPVEFLPRVTIQLPFFNEMYVAERLVRAAAQLDYPRDLMEIQVLDDSIDETTGILERLVRELQSEGVNILYLHRTERTGYKAGALAQGLITAKGEFVAIFDADFVPPVDFLRRALPVFVNPRIAFVQARWGHLNRNYSLLTRLQSLAIDAHFIIEQTARSSRGFWFNFNGTAGVWRKQAIEDAGGWHWDTLTEDLDLSYRAFLHGWQAAYLPDLVVPAELPVSFNAYRVQQHRWARGSLECAVKLIPQVWHSPLSLLNKIEATLHLVGYGIHLLLFVLAILYPAVVLLSLHYPALVSLFGFSFFLSITGLAPTIFFITAQKELGRSWLRLLPAILFMSALGSGMMTNTAHAAYQILGRRVGVFERTPKYGIVHKQQDWKRNKHYQLGFSPQVVIEFLMAFWNIGTLILAIRVGDWGIGLYAGIFSIGLFFVAVLSVSQSGQLQVEPAERVIPLNRPGRFLS